MSTKEVWFSRLTREGDTEFLSLEEVAQEVFYLKTIGIKAIIRFPASVDSTTQKSVTRDLDGLVKNLYDSWVERESQVAREKIDQDIKASGLDEGDYWLR